ncbi:14393_t:CDS:1, partial [Racocetra persica]
FELQMYTVYKDGDPSDERLSYRKLSEPTIFEFTKEKLKFFENIKHEHILRWFVAVSDKSTSSPGFRLLAISCINIKDLESFIDKTQPKKETIDHGLTFVFMITNNSITPIDNKELQVEYGGIVKLFSEKDSRSSQNAEKDKDKQEIGSSSQNAEKDKDNQEISSSSQNAETDKDYQEINISSQNAETDKDNQEICSNSQNDEKDNDGYFLIILTLSG